MIKFIFGILVFIGIVSSAYVSAHKKKGLRPEPSQLRIGMTEEETRSNFGAPTAINRNEWIYIMPDSSELSITLRDQKVTSAKLKYREAVKVTDPELKQLTLVQMDNSPTQSGEPNWFFAGKPEVGLIYKITSAGRIESITWVPRFKYGNNRPKKVQALVRDFNRRELVKM
jgi:hypothetical protein